MLIHFGTTIGANGKKYSRVADIKRDFLEGKMFEKINDESAIIHCVSIRHMVPGDTMTVQYGNGKTTLLTCPKKNK